MSRSDHLQAIVTLIEGLGVVDQVLDYAPIVPLAAARQAVVIGTGSATADATFDSYDVQHQIGVWLYVQVIRGQERQAEQQMSAAVEAILLALREAGYAAGPSAIVPGQFGSLLHQYEAGGTRWFRVERLPVRPEDTVWEDDV